MWVVSPLLKVSSIVDGMGDLLSLGCIFIDILRGEVLVSCEVFSIAEGMVVYVIS